MKNFTKILTISTIALSLTSCAVFENLMQKKEVQQLDYLEGANKMDLKKFFDGNLEGFAIKQDASGKIASTFTVKINGKWEEGKGVIQFNYFYNDGTKDSRTWLITTNSDNSFDAVGHDVTTPAKGKQIGNAAQSIYSLMVGPKTDKEEMSFEDKMYLVDEKSVIMISNFKSKKSAKGAGKIILSIKKVANQ
jgi:hypothetical protein